MCARLQSNLSSWCYYVALEKSKSSGFDCSAINMFSDHVKRIRLSKAISKKVRQFIRERATDRTRVIFCCLQIFEIPNLIWAITQTWWSFFTSIYVAEDHIEHSCKEVIRRLPCLFIDELKCVLQQMASNLCLASYTLQNCQIYCWDFLFQICRIDQRNDWPWLLEWLLANFALYMLPKSGDMTLPKKNGPLQSSKYFTRSVHGWCIIACCQYWILIKAMTNLASVLVIVLKMRLWYWKVSYQKPGNAIFHFR